MTGLAAGCRDLKISADRFLDEQNLFDISIQSTLGLTEDDVEALQALSGVEKAEGSFSEIVHTKKGEVNKTAEVKVLNQGGVNLPYIVEGVLPQEMNEIAVTQNYITETGKQIGDTLTIEEILEEEDADASTSDDTKRENSTDEEAALESEEDSSGEMDIEAELDIEVEEEAESPNFLQTTFTITGVVIDAMDINNAEGSVAFRATPNADYTFFVTPQAVESDVYTAIYLSLEGTDELLCFSEEYEEKTAAVISVIETEIMNQREQLRYEEVTEEAYEKVYDAEKEMNDAFADIEQEFADAELEIEDGWKEIADGRQELLDKEAEVAQEIADAKIEIEDGYKKIEEAEEELLEGELELDAGAKKLQEGRQELKKQEKKAWNQIEEAETSLENQLVANATSKEQMTNSLSGIKNLLGSAWTSQIQTSWDDLVSAAEQVLLPGIKEQAANGASDAGDTQQQLAQLTALLNQSTEYQTAQTEFATNIAPVISAMSTELGTQKTTLEAQLTAVESTIVGLETELTNLENDKQNLTGDALAEVEAKITEKTAELEAAKESKASMESAITALNEQITSLPQLTQNLIQLAIGTAQVNATDTVLVAGQAELEAQKAEAQKQFEEAWEQIELGESELAQGRAKIAEGKKEIEENRQKLDDALIELAENEEKAAKEFADARVELADGEVELTDGEEELAENKITYEEKKTEAIDKITEAKEEIADIDMTQWYVQDRTSLSGYVNVESDASCIESLATVFSVVFFIVAILISLTTVTRMVEEERGLIGTYKALGFTDREIRKKYVTYAFAASVFGGLLGDIGGFVLLPEVLFIFFDVMYMLPHFYLRFEVVSGTISVLLFIIGIAGAAYVACFAELKHLPAHLMRPKAPKMGSRVFLEYITPLWKRFSFLNKVTARNLFRYKKRFFMTVLGIMGCTSLLVFGFAIKDSVSELMPMQYENIYKYDLLAAAVTEDNDKLTEYMDNSPEVNKYLNIQVETVKIKNTHGNTEKVQIMIFPDGEPITEYLTLTDTDLNPLSLGDEGIYLTENAAIILNLEEGENVAIQKMNLEQEETKVSGIVKNYLGNNIYMTQTAYEKVFGEYEPNGILADLSEDCTDPVAYSDVLAQEDWILSALSTQELKDGFSSAFTLINIVVYVVLFFAAGLAFVVLFTLASVNISERIRELATIKVLGFFDREVHLYVNKETLILTGIGILVGLPVGAAMSGTLTSILEMPSIYFAVTIYPRSYFFAAGLALLFAFLVQFMTDRTLDTIAPAEALKSVE